MIKIESKLFDYVIKTLKDYYGDNNNKWWIEGIPMSIRTDCSSRWERANRQGNTENQLYLIDHMAICHKNWDLFKDVISLDSPNKQNKTANTKWIKNLNDIRNITAHAAQGVLSKEQVTEVNQLYEKVLEYFPE